MAAYVLNSSILSIVGYYGNVLWKNIVFCNHRLNIFLNIILLIGIRPAQLYSMTSNVR